MEIDGAGWLPPVVQPENVPVSKSPFVIGETGVVTVKLDALVPVPPPFVTAIGPVVAPVGTLAVICVSELTLKVVAFVPLKATLVAPVKLVPVIVTDVPTGPLVGVKELTVGAAGGGGGGGGGVPLQPGSWNEPMRVFQLSCESVVGCES